MFLNPKVRNLLLGTEFNSIWTGWETDGEVPGKPWAVEHGGTSFQLGWRLNGSIHVQ